MGCGCNKKKTSTTEITSADVSERSADGINLDTVEWGPLYWRILHGLTELTGNKKINILDMYEEHKWHDVLNSLPDILPCTECRAHCRAYIAANRPEPIIRRQYTDRRTGLRAWFYNLHSQTPKINTITTPAIDELPILYKNINFRADFKQMFIYIDEAVRKGVVESAISYKFKRQLDDLMLLLGIARNAR
jgi:hypothetical protein